ncbi:hypothetical protein E2562_019224 [Oryza meyeriana var. granulata]|uniref:Uncharacterized protein n=1 Tax=Oryza meyeriana var. granulata TaxID=110450 RepID=A0A6G1FA27_9ORYZ|nr:hypothetical protein E2562_019224 [Oryza meyeriana var. granulata]
MTVPVGLGNIAPLSKPKQYQGVWAGDGTNRQEAGFIDDSVTAVHFVLAYMIDNSLGNVEGCCGRFYRQNIYSSQEAQAGAHNNKWLNSHVL